jgi:hypothetical protein
LNPSAVKVHAILSKEGETVLNDHVAFRTFNTSDLNLDKMAKVFLNFGYKPKGEYVFVEKKLFARHYEHPDLTKPKVFISHLEIEKLSSKAQQIIQSLVAQVPKGFNEKADFCVSGRPWKVTHTEYKTLLEESEYAAWMSAFGFRVNHFTVNVNALKKFNNLQALNDFIKSNGYKLNAAGGEIKGSKDVYLEQSSTLADKVKVQFSDGTFEIPSVYYEFALRYKLADGKLYQGFVEKSADKIFESTDTKQQR